MQYESKYTNVFKRYRTETIFITEIKDITLTITGGFYP